MRVVHSDVITEHIRKMCIRANIDLAADVKEAIVKAKDTEESPIGKQVLDQLQQNMNIAEKASIPICQDTGMAVVFIKLGQDVHIEGENLEDAINEGIRRGYRDGYLRKSIVGDPIERINTNDNTPGIIHLEMVSGEQIEITVAPKGFGSENMSRIYMLKPSDGLEGVKKAVLETVELAGPNACPPIIVGVGMGGTFEKAALLAKTALIRNINIRSEVPYIKKLEEELLYKINCLGIGPAGLGGRVTALAVNIETYATHIAGLPVAINLCCHVCRHVTDII